MKKILNLSGKWHFKEYPLNARRMRDLDEQTWHETAVPSSIFHSLIDAGIITQENIDSDPENLAWVSEKSWVYSKSFDIDAELLESDRKDLVFDGLDTAASIWLNEKLIGKTNNMFIPWRFNVKGILRPKDNRLLVKFDPARPYAQKLMQRYGVFKEEQFANPCRVYIRKAQYQFGWDFCPSLDGCGIWRACRLEGISKARFEDIHISTIDANQHYADIRIAVKLDTIVESDFTCRLKIHGGAFNLAQELKFKKGQNFQSALMRIDRPFLWWPKGYGIQYLYNLDAHLFANGELVDSEHHHFGVRTIKLLRTDSTGPNFQFEVNGQPVYIKGANWIPVTLTPGRFGYSDYEQLLKAAANANFNMLRVWGGGYYENCEFYEYCDRLGILVWQDFMFASAYYPDRQWFEEQVKIEAGAVIKKLRNYACVALWCGNDKIDYLHKNAAFGKSKKFYGKNIFHKLLPRLVRELDTRRDYIPTGHYENINSACPVTAGSKDIEEFVAKFGVASLPSMETLKTFIPAKSLYIGNRQLEKHNYQLNGNSSLFSNMCDLFGSAKDLNDFVYKTQLTQARVLKMQVEYLRSQRQRNHGILFRQFADCCPSISCSAIDHQRRFKALYYYARRFFSGLLITAVPSYVTTKHNIEPRLQSLNLIAVNDTPNPVTATLNAELIDLSGSIIDRTSLPAAISPHSTSSMLTLARNFVNPVNPAERLLHIYIAKDGKILTENMFLYMPDKYINWPEPQISRELFRCGENLWKCRLTCQASAKDVEIATAVPATISDNFFDMLPGHEYELTINSDHDISAIPKPITTHSVKALG